jgi:hypothetical protein
MHAFKHYLYEHEIDLITKQFRRSDATMEAILTDFFATDVPPFDIDLSNLHIDKGLNCMYNAFKPPNRCQPVHLLDIKHHYHYKWQVNSEPPFSTDAYFLKLRPTFREFIQTHEMKYIDQADFERRHGSDHSDTFLDTITPAKFGFQRAQVFSWTRRWHHVIKSGFTDLAGLYPDDPYLKKRYIFPMLLHTKTAIVKKDDPNKMRTIWGCSKPWILADTIFWWEYLAWIKLNPGITPMLWGFETFTGGWMRLNLALTSSLARSSFLTLDWSRFDKKAYFKLILAILNRVRHFLDFTHGYVPTVLYPAYPQWTEQKTECLNNLWNWTLECIFKSPIVLPNGEMYIRNFAGIPSGLFITQLLDSWYNYTMLASLLSMLDIDPETTIIKVQGDDSIIRLGTLIPPAQHDHFLDRVSELAKLHFNADISREKSELHASLQRCEVLSYRNNRGIPMRDEIKMLSQFYFTRSRDPSPDITMAQAIGFAYASCGHHDRVYRVCEDIYNYYLRQGYSPNRAGITAIFGNSPDNIAFPFSLDHFPLKSEIQQFYLHTEYRNEESIKATWPLDYFLRSPGTFC